MLFGNAVEPSHVTFCLAPKVFDAVYVIAFFSKFLAVIDAYVMEPADVEYIIAAEGSVKNFSLFCFAVPFGY